MVNTALVTGAYGFIGRHVAKKLSSEGCQVTGIGHGLWDKQQWNQYGITEFVQGDLTFENLKELLSKPYDIIIHCAGSGSVSASYEDPRNDFKSNVYSTHELLEYVRIYSPASKVIIISSAAVYGCVTAIKIKEDHPLNPVSPYGIHKKIVEELCLYYSSNYHINIGIVRFFSLYGIGLQKQLLWDVCRKTIAGEFSYFGTGNEIRDYLHINDAINIIICLIQRSFKGSCIVNGGCGIGVTTKDIIMNIQTQLLRYPRFSFTNQIREGDPPYLISDISKIQSMGWNYQIPLDKGIKEYVYWFKSLNKDSHD